MSSTVPEQPEVLMTIRPDLRAALRLFSFVVVPLIAAPVLIGYLGLIVNAVTTGITLSEALNLEALAILTRGPLFGITLGVVCAPAYIWLYRMEKAKSWIVTTAGIRITKRGESDRDIPWSSVKLVRVNEHGPTLIFNTGERAQTLAFVNQKSARLLYAVWFARQPLSDHEDSLRSVAPRMPRKD